MATGCPDPFVPLMRPGEEAKGGGQERRPGEEARGGGQGRRLREEAREGSLGRG